LGGIFLVFVASIGMPTLRLAYMHIGLGSRATILLLLTSLAGSYLNIPIARPPESRSFRGRNFRSSE
jgi:uncharacterized membrane protein